MADVFISYSRRDQEFVRELVARLTERGKECWVDWDDIPPTAAFLQEIYEGIEASNAFLFVISPDSARSEVCRDEIEHAAENNKRIVPLLRREPDGTPLPEAVASLNWIPIPESADLDGAVDQLVEVLAQDLDHVRRHTRTLQKAHEWSKADEDSSLLLRGSELRAAEDWIQAGAEKEPAPTQLHYRYLQASRAAAAKRQRQTVAAFAVGTAVALTLAVVALIQRSHAVEASHVAESRLLASEAQSQLGHHLGTGALLALAAYRVKHTPEARLALAVAVKRGERLRALLDTGGVRATAVAFAPTGSLLAAGLEDGTVLVYGGQRRSLLAHLRVGSGQVSSVSFSRDGHRILAGTAEGWIGLWRAGSRGTRFRRLPFRAHGEAVAFGPGDHSLLLGTSQGLEWRRANGTPFHKLKTRDPVTELAVAPDGTIAFGGSYGAYLVGPKGNPQPVPGANDVIQGLAFDPDGRRLALIVYGAGRLWTVGERASERISPETSALAFGPAGRLVTGGLSGDVVVRNGPGKGALLGQLGNATIQSVDARAGVVAATSQDGLALWSTAGSELQRNLPAHGQDILDDLAVLGRHNVAIAVEDALAKPRLGVKDIRSGAWQPLEQAPSGGPVNVAASADGRVLAAGGASQKVTVWSGKGFERRKVLVPSRNDDPVDLALAPDGRTLVEGTDHNHLNVWALGAAHRPSVIRISGKNAQVAFAPSGKEVAVGGSDGKVVRLRPGSKGGEAVGSLGDSASAVAFSPDGKRIAAAGTNGAVAVWRPGSSHSLSLGVGTDTVGAIGFDPHGLTLAAGDVAGRLDLWDARTGFSLSPTIPLSQPIVAVHFDPSGRMLLVGLAGGQIVQLGQALWDPTAAIDYLCARLNGRLAVRERALYHIPGNAPSDLCR
jgi:WD40 repeat protein